MHAQHWLQQLVHADLQRALERVADDRGAQPLPEEGVALVLETVMDERTDGRTDGWMDGLWLSI